MYKFGNKSNSKLITADLRLVEIADMVIKIIDHSVLEGHRNEEKQGDMFHKNLSKLEWPNSKHNTMPSKAIDVAPYPIDWNDIARFTQLVGAYKGVALMLGYEIRCGCDWDGDGDIRDQSFMDYPHIEIVDA